MVANDVMVRVNKYLSKNNDGCWIWVGCTSGRNAVITISGKTKSVKRLLLSNKYPSSDLTGYLKSSCGNIKCLNPDHVITKQQWFNSLIKENTDTGCLEWQGFKKGGYGYFYVNGREKAVHRMQYEKFKGLIPKGYNVCHSCDNPPCVNPDHLWVGTQQENIKDMISKGRDLKAIGPRNKNSKISSHQAREVKLLYSQGHTIKNIHLKLGLTYKTVQHICNGTTWKHV